MKAAPNQSINHHSDAAGRLPSQKASRAAPRPPASSAVQYIQYHATVPRCNRCCRQGSTVCSLLPHVASLQKSHRLATGDTTVKEVLVSCRAERGTCAIFISTLLLPRQGVVEPGKLVLQGYPPSCEIAVVNWRL
jgi:hypothetical protein